jgi:hypothetical protein
MLDHVIQQANVSTLLARTFGCPRKASTSFKVSYSKNAKKIPNVIE